MATIERAHAHISEPAGDGVETGSFASSNALETARRTFIIASYNIRYCAGSYLITGGIGRRLGLKRPARRFSLIHHHLQKAVRALSDGLHLPSPDIVALQETDKLTLRAGGRHDIARRLAIDLQMHYARAAAVCSPGEEPQPRKWYLDFEEHLEHEETGDTGIAVLSRLPFASAARIDLPWSDCEWRPRLALQTEIQTGDGESLHIFNSHIDPHAAINEQLEQHEAILARAADVSGAVVLLGDFNTLTGKARREMRRLLESKDFSTPMPTGTPTWRAGLLRLHTDWIFVRGAKTRRWGVARLRGISDHWPVWAEIDLRDETSR
ncbi:MAG TPA: endonuclease/exonuclease/phosphatase family protein [Pyrinomonadaceae bacterium]|nr:endonuclease/exonuclease/phosphatase family protein [Pyrinomonadaceae bacterium]